MWCSRNQPYATLCRTGFPRKQGAPPDIDEAGILARGERTPDKEAARKDLPYLGTQFPCHFGMRWGGWPFWAASARRLGRPMLRFVRSGSFFSFTTCLAGPERAHHGERRVEPPPLWSVTSLLVLIFADQQHGGNFQYWPPPGPQ